MADQALDAKTEATTLANTDLVYALAGANDRKIQASNLATTLAAKMVTGDVVGTTDTQTLTNKTITQPILTLTQSATPTPTAEGVIEWDTDNDQLKVGDGSGTKVFSDDSSLSITASQVSDFDTEVSNNELVAANTTHISSDGSDHTFIDQSVISGSTPTFTGTNFTGVPDGGLSSGATVVSAGAGDSGKLVKLDADGNVDASAINDADIDHTNIGSIGTNTHAQIDTHIAASTAHEIAGDVVGTTDTQTLTNKTLIDISNTIHSNLVYFSARNSTGAQLDKGTAVYVSGYNVGQDLVEVDKADSDNSSALPCVGLLEDDISNNTNGKVIQTGVLSSFDTSSYSVGDELFVDTTPGSLTATKPTGDAENIQKVAVVIRSNIATGALAVFGAGRVNDVPNKIDQKTLVLKQGTTPTPTAEGDIQWDTDDNTIKIGDGASTKTFSDDVTKAAATETLTNKTIDGDDNTVQDLPITSLKSGVYQTTLTDSDTNLATSGGVFDHVAEIDLQTQTGTSYTLVLADKGKLVTMNNASANTLTIPANSSVAFPVGTQIEIAQLGAGQTTIAITTDTLNSSGGATKLTGQYSSAVITKITTTSWILAGDITT